MGEIANLINGLTLTGVPLIILIPILIGAFRGWGMSERWTGPVAALLGVLCMATVQSIKVWPAIEMWIAIPVLGLLVGLGSNGAFSQFKMWREKLSGDFGDGDGDNSPARSGDGEPTVDLAAGLIDEPPAETAFRNRFGSRE